MDIFQTPTPVVRSTDEPRITTRSRRRKQHAAAPSSTTQQGLLLTPPPSTATVPSRSVTRSTARSSPLPSIRDPSIEYPNGRGAADRHHGRQNSVSIPPHLQATDAAELEAGDDEEGLERLGEERLAKFKVAIDDLNTTSDQRVDLISQEVEWMTSIEGTINHHAAEVHDIIYTSKLCNKEVLDHPKAQKDLVFIGERRQRDLTAVLQSAVENIQALFHGLTATIRLDNMSKDSAQTLLGAYTSLHYRRPAYTPYPCVDAVTRGVVHDEIVAMIQGRGKGNKRNREMFTPSRILKHLGLDAQYQPVPGHTTPEYGSNETLMTDYNEAVRKDRLKMNSRQLKTITETVAVIDEFGLLRIVPKSERNKHERKDGAPLVKATYGLLSMRDMVRIVGKRANKEAKRQCLEEYRRRYTQALKDLEALARTSSASPDAVEGEGDAAASQSSASYNDTSASSLSQDPTGDETEISFPPPDTSFDREHEHEPRPRDNGKSSSPPPTTPPPDSSSDGSQDANDKDSVNLKSSVPSSPVTKPDSSPCNGRDSEKNTGIDTDMDDVSDQNGEDTVDKDTDNGTEQGLDDTIMPDIDDVTQGDPEQDTERDMDDTHDKDLKNGSETDVEDASMHDIDDMNASSSVKPEKQPIRDDNESTCLDGGAPKVISETTTAKHQLETAHAPVPSSLGLNANHTTSPTSANLLDSSSPSSSDGQAPMLSQIDQLSYIRMQMHDIEKELEKRHHFDPDSTTEELGELSHSDLDRINICKAYPYLSRHIGAMHTDLVKRHINSHILLGQLQTYSRGISEYLGLSSDAYRSQHIIHKMTHVNQCYFHAEMYRTVTNSFSHDINLSGTLIGMGIRQLRPEIFLPPGYFRHSHGPVEHQMLASDVDTAVRVVFKDRPQVQVLSSEAMAIWRRRHSADITAKPPFLAKDSTTNTLVMALNLDDVHWIGVGARLIRGRTTSDMKVSVRVMDSLSEGRNARLSTVRAVMRAFFTAHNMLIAGMDVQSLKNVQAQPDHYSCGLRTIANLQSWVESNTPCSPASTAELSYEIFETLSRAYIESMGDPINRSRRLLDGEEVDLYRVSDEDERMTILRQRKVSGTATADSGAFPLATVNPATQDGLAHSFKHDSASPLDNNDQLPSPAPTDPFAPFSTESPSMPHPPEAMDIVNPTLASHSILAADIQPAVRPRSTSSDSSELSSAMSDAGLERLMRSTPETDQERDLDAARSLTMLHHGTGTSVVSKSNLRRRRRRSARESESSADSLTRPSTFSELSSEDQRFSFDPDDFQDHVDTTAFNSLSIDGNRGSKRLASGKESPTKRRRMQDLDEE